MRKSCTVKKKGRMFSEAACRKEVEGKAQRAKKKEAQKNMCANKPKRKMGRASCF